MKFIDTAKNIWDIKELREKIIVTLTLIVIYRLASYISLPAIDYEALNNINETAGKETSGILGILNSFTGGAFNRVSVMALGIMPYISASIVVQLAGLAVPYIQKLQKEGESGRKTITQITRWLTIIICVVQGSAYLTSITQYFIPYGDPMYAGVYLVNPVSQKLLFAIPSIAILVAGTIFAMWMGEKITEKGIGNGISILIMVGILADLPAAFFTEFELQNNILFLLELVVWLAIVAFCVILVTAVRKVPVQYVGRSQAGSSRFMKSATEAVRSYIPLKVNAAGVMPIIFAQALMFIPGLLSKTDEQSTFLAEFNNPFSWQYNVLFVFMIIIFTYFYTAIAVPVKQIADDLKKNGGLIPKVKPGKETEDYLDNILSLITFPGSLLIALVAILPSVVKMIGLVDNTTFAHFFGGTSLLIMVGVILDTVQQINTYLLNHHYDGLMDSKLSRSSI